MQAESQLDLDISDQAWADAPGEIVKAVMGKDACTVTVRAAAAAAPNALSAQLLAFLRQHVEIRGGRFCVEEPSQAFTEGLALLGLDGVIIGSEDAD
ncbi:hypothetical protein SAMN05444722_0165 [Rhodovulum sp. ES.010]|uniref:hypothetical protein n=1 Tax=Rhodovulum sp. ES.010 TaxID=1882821 RepID=UPI0009284AC1|nr:hypothetical protein [Rhodovulum sp. ES.010]SIO02873.1 hypothetical protein SAMN05444722_0165 [Rhodovulum sp. ES.010]